MKDFQPKQCECCKQTTEVLYSIDTGTADLVKAMWVYLCKKGINKVNFRTEMEMDKRQWNYGHLKQFGKITANHSQNSIRAHAHAHGLIAKVKGESGVWCITSKGEAFIKGEPVHKHAVFNKAEKRTTGYYGDEMACIKDMSRDGLYWEGSTHTINLHRLVPVQLPTTTKNLFHVQV